MMLVVNLSLLLTLIVSHIGDKSRHSHRVVFDLSKLVNGRHTRHRLKSRPFTPMRSRFWGRSRSLRLRHLSDSGFCGFRTSLCYPLLINSRGNCLGCAIATATFLLWRLVFGKRDWNFSYGISRRNWVILESRLNLLRGFMVAINSDVAVCNLSCLSIHRPLKRGDNEKKDESRSLKAR